MAYRFEILKAPAEMCETGGTVAYLAHAVVVGEGTIEKANEAGMRVVRNHLAMRSDVTRNGDVVSENKGWRYYVRWIDKPRVKKFHNLYRNKFLGNAAS